MSSEFVDVQESILRLQQEVEEMEEAGESAEGRMVVYFGIGVGVSVVGTLAACISCMRQLHLARGSPTVSRLYSG